MRLQSTDRPLPEIAADVLAVGLCRDSPTIPTSLQGTPAATLLERLIAEGELARAIGDVTPIFGAEGLAARRLYAFGLGDSAAIAPGSTFAAGVALAKRLAAQPRESVAVALPPGGESSAIASALVEGLIVGTRGPDLRKASPGRHPFGSLTIASAGDAPWLDRALRRGQVVGESINLARDLANTPPAEKSPTRLAEIARAASLDAGLEVEVWAGPKILDERFGGLAAVAAGSAQPPAFVILRYKGGEGPPTALVGKGVTFDSGGLSLKPSAGMEDMKADMTGAAVVLASMIAVSRLGLKVNIDGYLPLTENMTGGHAMKLGDVLTMRDGTTVEVMNTDAEGRLILADALAYAAEQHPARIIDLATLTGACLVALGPKIAGLFSVDEALAAAIAKAAAHTGERVWRLPMDDDFSELLKSPVADLKNVGGKHGGATTAAKFLQRFAGTAPWAHLDIAGPSWADADGPTRDAGGTGCFVRTLVALLEEI